MKVECPQCAAVYDDAMCTTICPHEAFLTERQAAQKDLAASLIGKRVHFAHEDESRPHRIRTVLWDGLVEIEGMEGSFVPHLLVVMP